MLERSGENIVENIRNFFVAEYKSEVIGCCAIAFYTLEACGNPFSGRL